MIRAQCGVLSLARPGQGGGDTVARARRPTRGGRAVLQCGCLGGGGGLEEEWQQAIPLISWREAGQPNTSHCVRNTTPSPAAVEGMGGWRNACVGMGEWRIWCWPCSENPIPETWWIVREVGGGRGERGDVGWGQLWQRESDKIQSAHGCKQSPPSSFLPSLPPHPAGHRCQHTNVHSSC